MKTKTSNETTVTIGARHYSCAALPVQGTELLASYRLRRLDESGAVYNVAVRSDDVPLCDCPDHEFRRTQIDPLGCKHIRALRTLGFLTMEVPLDELVR